MNRTLFRASVVSALAAPVVLLSSGIAAAAPTVGVVGNDDLTITVTPTADSNGLRECEFKIYDSSETRVAKKEAKYKDGAAVESITFGPYAAGLYSVSWECKDNNKTKFENTVSVRVGETSVVSSVEDLLGPLRALLGGLSLS
ncbi:MULTISPECIES: hypothetical protein [unclassified Rhodococcus (in: high G+C Gram-positive bacteria)]|uniref:hypothetical protein n=1 Tax=unclassified Rhodococcus (in: high G+C Gram-positive bacteria) TaxID=192944 RepID=UPI002294C8C7|nr:MULTISPECIES: hypothetical protein [unclassified Rhodococcus (in: high G+C Gram-positive bacteria)]MCY4669756.1 hypothetical protein [Rhodococcus sp. (in: high G+C Gram-positive bacteria)]MDF3319808.1 hypothetical protein [Rhodococcus sp. C3V]